MWYQARGVKVVSLNFLRETRSFSWSKLASRTGSFGSGTFRQRARDLCWTVLPFVLSEPLASKIGHFQCEAVDSSCSCTSKLARARYLIVRSPGR